MHQRFPAIAEPFFLWLNAEVTFLPVMKPEDLAKAGPAIGAAAKKWRSPDDEDYQGNFR